MHYRQINIYTDHVKEQLHKTGYFHGFERNVNGQLCCIVELEDGSIDLFGIERCQFAKLWDQNSYFKAFS